MAQAALAILLLAAVATLAFAQSMVQAMSHDENQFAVGGWWLGQHGLLPYRDYPFHHLPNLVFLFAIVSLLTSELLLSARLISVAFGIGTLALVSLFAWSHFRSMGRLTQWALAIGAGLVTLLSPLFNYTSGRAWNHDLPTLLALGALMVHLGAIERGYRSKGWILSGLLLGLAVGSRIAFLPALIPFLVASLLGPSARAISAWRASSIRFLAGFAASLLPAIVLFWIAPSRFLYGTAVYPRLNTSYRQALWHPTAMNLPEKLVYFYNQVVADPPHSLLFVAGLALIAWLAYRKRLLSLISDPAFALTAGVALFLWFGSLAPTPSWYQYFYAPLPFAVLALALVCRRALEGVSDARVIMGAVALICLGTIALRWTHLSDIPADLRRDRWVPLQVDDLGERVAENVSDGRLLTLAPIIAAEGGMLPYPEFTTGSFDWRVARILSAQRRGLYGVVSPRELSAMLDSYPPAGILMGFEAGNEGFSPDQKGGLEQPLADYAKSRGFRQVELGTPLLPRNAILWVPP